MPCFLIVWSGGWCVAVPVALGTPSLLQNLPRQRSNQDLDDDGSQDVEELSSLGVDESSGGTSGQVSGTETSAVEGGDDTSSGSHQVILRLLEDGETVSHRLMLTTVFTTLALWQTFWRLHVIRGLSMLCWCQWSNDPSLIHFLFWCSHQSVLFPSLLDSDSVVSRYVRVQYW